MASFYGKYNIQINAVSPGAVIGHLKGSKQKQEETIFRKNTSKHTKKLSLLPRGSLEFPSLRSRARS